MSNTQVIFAKLPTGLPNAEEHFTIRKVPFDLETVQLDADAILLKNLVLSVDPFLRGRMRDPSIKSYFPALKVGEPLDGFGIGRVESSRNNSFKVGDYVVGMIGWEEYTLAGKDRAMTFQVRNDLKNSDLQLDYHLGVLGMPGITAYVGLLKFGAPFQKGETLFVSAASGAVGQLVGQIGKLKGLRVIGSAGDDLKVEYLVKDCGFDAAFNYKKTSIEEALNFHAPKGIDIYFDNVGGEMLDTVILHANSHARIIGCGNISQYNIPKEQQYRLCNAGLLVPKRIRYWGFIASDHYQEYHDQFVRDVTSWLKSGQVKYKVDETVGIENAPDAFVGMLQGRNFGKQVVKIADVSY